MMKNNNRNSNEKTGLVRRGASAGSWYLTRRLLKRVPFIGTAVAVGLAGETIRRKGLKNGLIDVALDATPIVGTVKGVAELVTGEWLPNRTKEQKRR